VVIHPQSVIHSMVVCRDHSVLAQLGTPDMRVPIAYGLAFPERIESGAAALDFATLGALSFEPADLQRFPGLALAWEVLRGAEGSSAVLNAANEVAVAAFLAGTIRFDQIHSINAQALAAVVAAPGECASAEGLLQLDARARAHAARHVEGPLR
jgi:1-deoxy-D-xylulose-5-phosphate reductoisomerase